MKITAISDIHGQLPDPKSLPAGDVLVIAGDICPDFGRTITELEGTGKFRQSKWLENEFRTWLEEVEPSFQAVIGIAGNHDYVFEHKTLIPKGLHWIYLEDSGVEIDGVRFWGRPWVPNLPAWAFHGTDAVLEASCGAIPDDTDVLITHGPPYGALDAVMGGSKRGNPMPIRVGESHLNHAINRVAPKAVICGHIHEQHGIKGLIVAPTVLYNVSMLDDCYDMVYPPTEIVVV